MAKAQATPPILRRRLGGLLRQYRTATGTTLVTAAAVLNWENTRLSRVETGQYQIKADEAAKLLNEFGITDPEIVDEVTRVAPGSGHHAWWRAFEDVLPQTYADIIALESEAVLLRAYFPQLIPALLQTPAYAHALISSSPRAATQKTATALVQVRQARKEILTRPTGPTELRTVIDESALYPRAGSADLMRDQLLSLLDMSERPNITLRIMPLDAPLHSGLTSNMTVMDFRKPWPSLAMVDHTRGGVFLEEPKDVTAFTEVFDAVCETALPTDESRDVIKKYLKGTSHA